MGARLEEWDIIESAEFSVLSALQAPRTEFQVLGAAMLRSDALERPYEDNLTGMKRYPAPELGELPPLREENENKPSRNKEQLVAFGVGVALFVPGGMAR